MEILYGCCTAMKRNLVDEWRQVESDWAETSKEGYRELNRAIKDGDYTTVKRIIETNRKLIFKMDINGRTPLHNAAMKGRVDFLRMLLNACPEYVKEVTLTGKTCLHTAVMYNKGKAVQYLVKWLGDNTHYTHLINSKDHDGHTPLHLATSRKQLQTLKALLTCNPSISKWVDVNAVSSGGITALDILYVLPYGGKIDMEIDRILRRAGALRARDLRNHDLVNGCKREQCMPYHMNKMGDIVKPKIVSTNDVLLVTATLLAIATLQAALNCSGSLFKQSNHNVYGTFQPQKGDPIISRSFILFNSIGFISSLSTIIFLLHEFPLKPWPQILVSTLFGSYMCSIMVISPQQALPLLILSIPFLLLAATGKLFGFSRQVSRQFLSRSFM